MVIIFGESPPDELPQAFAYPKSFFAPQEHAQRVEVVDAIGKTAIAFADDEWADAKNIGLPDGGKDFFQSLRFPQCQQRHEQAARRSADEYLVIVAALPQQELGDAACKSALAAAPGDDERPHGGAVVVVVFFHFLA